MAVLKNGRSLEFEAQEESHLMLLGGDFLGSRFPEVSGDNREFIPLPDELAPKGTPL